MPIVIMDAKKYEDLINAPRNSTPQEFIAKHGVDLFISVLFDRGDTFTYGRRHNDVVNYALACLDSGITDYKIAVKKFDSLFSHLNDGQVQALVRWDDHYADRIETIYDYYADEEVDYIDLMVGEMY